MDVALGLAQCRHRGCCKNGTASFLIVLLEEKVSMLTLQNIPS